LTYSFPQCCSSWPAMKLKFIAARYQSHEISLPQSLTNDPVCPHPSQRPSRSCLIRREGGPAFRWVSKGDALRPARSCTNCRAAKSVDSVGRIIIAIPIYNQLINQAWVTDGPHTVPCALSSSQYPPASFRTGMFGSFGACRPCGWPSTFTASNRARKANMSLD